MLSVTVPDVAALLSAAIIVYPATEKSVPVGLTVSVWRPSVKDIVMLSLFPLLLVSIVVALAMYGGDPSPALEENGTRLLLDMSTRAPESAVIKGVEDVSNEVPSEKP